MLGELTAILGENIARVENLVSLYGPPTRGRRKVKDTDVLRGAIVLLHAGLEDYLRGLMLWKIGTYNAETLNNYGFPTDQKRPPQKVTLGDLSAFRGKSVDELIFDSVKTHLNEFQSFNDLGEVKKALRQCGISPDAINEHEFEPLPEMIARRHNIVHKADRNEVVAGQGNHSTKSLGKAKVEAYVKSVKSLRDFVSESFDN